MPEVTGGVRLANGLPASGLRFQLQREVFGKEPEVVADVTTDEAGNFTLPDLDVDERTSLVAKVAGAGGEPSLLAPLSGRQDAASLNFVAPVGAAPTQSEFARLRAALRPVVGDEDIVALAAAVEDGTRSDISVAHRRTGWDARLIAVSSLAAQLAEGRGELPGIGVGAEEAYAMLRAGLPSDRDLLARVPRKTVEDVLTKAAASGIVELDADAITVAGERFEEFSVERRLEARPGGGLSSVRELLDASGLPDNGQDSARKKFQSVLLEHGDGPLWKRAKDAGLDANQVTALQSQAKLAFLTTNNLLLMKHVQEQSGDGGVAASIESRKWDLPATWKSALEEVGGRDAVPATYGDAEDAVETYAEELARRVRVAYPTQVVAALVSRGDLDLPGVGAAPMAKTLEAAADEGFRLGEQSPAVFLDEHADVIQGLDADAKFKVTSALETLHRVHQITPSNEAMRVLLEKGLNSAYDVVATSQNEFLDRYGSFFPSRHQALLVYRKSEQVTAVLYNFHAMTKQAVSSSVLGAVQGSEENRSAAVERIRKAMPSPTMESLFGSMDYCECDHCGSVLGPAAYFVDLLKFLDPDASEWNGFKAVWKLRHQGDDYPFATPYDELMARRPDLAHLTLTCDNTSSVLPTIDIVNEILEFILAEGKLTADTVHDSGMLSSAEVLAEPEFIESTVYDKVLRTTKSPHVLPFDLWHETTREFASKLGTPLVEILAAFAGNEEDELAVERLGLTEVEYATITADDPMTDWWTRFGFGAAAGEEAKALKELGRAKPLSRALGVSYQELVDLLGTRWVNPTLAELGVLTTARLSVADAVTWRNNKSLVGTDQPTDPEKKLTWTTVQSTQRRLDTVTSTYGLTGARKADAWLSSREEDLLNPVVVLADPDSSCNFELTFLATAGAGKALTGKALAQVLVRLDLFLRLQRRLGWTRDELDAALAAYLPDATPFGAPLRLAVRRLGRQHELADLLEYEGPRNVLTALWSSMDQSLYDGLFVAGPARDRDPVFVAPLGDPLSSLPAGTTVGKHVPALQSALGLTAADLAAVLEAEGHDNDTPLSIDIVDVLHRHAVLAAALGIEMPDLLTLRRLTGLAPLDGDPDAEVVDFVQTCLSVLRSPISVAELDLLAASSFDPEGELRPDLVAIKEALSAVAQGIAGIQVVTAEEQTEATAKLVKAVAAAFGRPVGILLDLLAFDTPMSADYRKLSDAVDHEDAVSAHMLLGRVLLLVDRLGLDADEVAEFRLTDLPVAKVEGAAPATAELLRLLDYVAVRDVAAGGSSELLGVLTAARTGGSAAERLEAAVARLASLTRRKPEDVTEVASTLALTAAALGTVDGVARLWSALRLVGKAGVPASTLSGWAKIAATATSDDDRHRIAREARDALRAMGGIAIWQRLAAPVNDRLRQRRRDALVAAALVQLGIGTREELYQHLLLDPGSEPVLRTSRIRQAISSVQMFVQRCLLGVEPRVHPSTLDADHWSWMRRYRVWEANRKIFLFPENWLEPEFRDDKSHLFQELESTLVQSDVTADLVEDAFLTYLRKLDEIARLEMCGMFWDQDPGKPGNNTLHVIGRTHGLPRQYFYRRQQHGAWTPWEPMGVEIEGDHIVPVVWRNRLHVFWVTFLEQPDSADASAAGDDGMMLKLEKDSAVLGAMGGVMAGGGGSGAAVSIGGTSSDPPKPLAQANVSDVKKTARGEGVKRWISVALHWSEYVAGKWSAPTSTGFGAVGGFSSRTAFDPGSVFVHSSNVYDGQGQEAGVQIHLTGGAVQTFLLRGRNSPAESGSNVPRPPVPFKGTRARVNHYDGSGAFTVAFNQRLTVKDGGAAVATPLTLTVLGSLNSFSLLPSSNAVTLGGSEIGSLVSPFFLSDSRRTFFVEPELVETKIETFESWLVPDPGPAVVLPPHIVENITLRPFVPELVKPDFGLPVPPKDNPWPEVFRNLPDDVLTGPSTGLLFGDRVLGPRGTVDVTTLTARKGLFAGPGVVHEGSPLLGGGDVQISNHELMHEVRPGEGLEPATVAVIRTEALENAGLRTDLTELNVVGGFGLATHLLEAIPRQRLGSGPFG